MNLTAIQSELQSRGFGYETSTTRLNYWINRAYHDICEDSDWPFLLTSVTAQSPPVTISDLRQIEYVFDATAKRTLDPADRRTIRELTTDLTTTGTPQVYYFTSQTVLTVYPVGGSLTVSYWKVPTDLSAGGDTPVIPTRWHYLIVDGAVLQAMKDSDDYQDRAQLQAAYDRELQAMRRTLITQQKQMPQFIASTRGHEGY